MRMLVGMNDNKIKMMNIDTGEILQVFEGHRQTQYMIRNAFGGAQETFVVSGSEGEFPQSLAMSSNAKWTPFRLADLHMADEWPVSGAFGSTQTWLREYCCLASDTTRHVRISRR